MCTTSKIVVCIGIIGLTLAIYFTFVYYDFTKENSLPNEPEVESSIRKIAIFFRHGERSPAADTATMNITSPNWPEGFGQLTKIGKVHSYNLGKRMRSRYSQVLSPYYSEKNVKVMSTKMERTIMSTSLVLGGMYPPRGHQVWNENLMWNPIPVYADTSLFIIFKCERFVYEYLKHKSTATTERTHAFVNLLKIHNIATPDLEDDVYFIYDALSALGSNEIKIEAWAKELLSMGSNLMAEWMTSLTAYTYIQKQLCSIFSDHLLRFISSDKKVLVYGNHDITLFMLAGTLGVTIEEFPLPTATIAIELHEKNGEQLVRAFYIASYNAPMRQVKMSCGNECPLDIFKQMLIDLQPEDYNHVCHGLPEPIDLYLLDRYISFFDTKDYKQFTGVRS